MNQLLDTVASWCRIAGFAIGVPGLTAIYLQTRQASKERSRSAWADMVKFSDVGAEVGVNISDFKNMPFLPRVGEEITIPESTASQGAMPRYGHYRVESIHYVCFSNDNGDAELGNIHIGLKSLAPASDTSYRVDGTG